MGATFLLRYGEIALKGQNQPYFLDSLLRNVERALAGLGRAEVRLAFGRVIVRTDAGAETAAERLRKVFGVVSLSQVRDVDLDLSAITTAANASTTG